MCVCLISLKWAKLGYCTHMSILRQDKGQDLNSFHWRLNECVLKGCRQMCIKGEVHGQMCIKGEVHHGSIAYAFMLPCVVTAFIVFSPDLNHFLSLLSNVWHTAIWENNRLSLLQPWALKYDNNSSSTSEHSISWSKMNEGIQIYIQDLAGVEFSTFAFVRGGVEMADS